MNFSHTHGDYIAVYTGINVNLAWIVQDYLQANGINANIEVRTCDEGSHVCSLTPSYSVCVPNDKVDQAKEYVEQCEACKIEGFLAS